MPGEWDGQWTAPPPAYEQYGEQAAPSPETEPEWTWPQGGGPGGAQPRTEQDPAPLTVGEIEFLQEDDLTRISRRWERESYLGPVDEVSARTEIYELAQARVHARDTGSDPQTVQSLIAQETAFLNAQWSSAVERGWQRAANEHAARGATGPRDGAIARQLARTPRAPGGRANGTGAAPSTTSGRPPRSGNRDYASNGNSNGQRQGRRPHGGRG